MSLLDAYAIARVQEEDARLDISLLSLRVCINRVSYVHVLGAMLLAW